MIRTFVVTATVGLRECFTRVHAQSPEDALASAALRFDLARIKPDAVRWEMGK